MPDELVDEANSLNDSQIKELNEEYDIDFETKYKEKIAKLVNDNLLQIEKGYVKVTKSNLYILDYIEKILLY